MGVTTENQCGGDDVSSSTDALQARGMFYTGYGEMRRRCNAISAVTYVHYTSRSGLGNVSFVRRCEREMNNTILRDVKLCCLVDLY
jgi:hypothetical protein